MASASRPRSADDLLADRNWRLIHSFWLLATFLPLGMLTWAAFVYIGARTRRTIWLISAVGYAIWVVAIFSVVGQNDGANTTQSGWLTAAELLLWVVGITHGFLSRRSYLTYLARMNARTNPAKATKPPGLGSIAVVPSVPPQDRSRPYPRHFATPSKRPDTQPALSPQTEPRPPATSPALPDAVIPTSRIRRPDQQMPAAPRGARHDDTPDVRRHFAPPPTRPTNPTSPILSRQHAGPRQEVTAPAIRVSNSSRVDVNSAGQGQLGALPGWTADRAATVIAIRDAQGGFRNVHDFTIAAALGVDSWADISALVTIGPRRTGTASSAKACYELAKKFETESDFNRARALFHHAIDLKNAWSSPAAFTLAEMLAKQHDTPAAEAVYQTVISSTEFTPSDQAQAAYRLGNLLRDQHDFNRARTFFHHAIDLKNAWSSPAASALDKIPIESHDRRTTETKVPSPANIVSPLINVDQSTGISDKAYFNDFALRHDSTRVQPNDAPSQGQGSIRWIPAGETVTVCGYKILGGMLYLGSNQSAGTVDPAVINDSLPVDQDRSDRDGDDLGYWPTYAGLNPRSRAAYLAWLAGGRRDPQLPIGYAFLFFYGLEGRVLRDLLHRDEYDTELQNIHNEVQRLRDIYGEDGSFGRYSGEFLTLLEGLRPEAGEQQPPYGREERWPPPLILRRRLSQFALAGLAVPYDWALSWAWYHPNIYPRTPQRRCPDRYQELFEIRYQQRHNDGLRIKKSGQPIRLTYHPSNRNISGTTLDLPDTFDVLEDPAASRALRSLSDEVTQELDAYSRYIGRHPDEGDTPAAVALLPLDLPIPAGGKAARLLDWAKTALGTDSSTVIDGAQLIELWSPAQPGVFTKAEAVSCAQLLERHRIGIEPDVRLGGPKATTGPVVLFDAHHESPRAAGAEYTAATNLLELAVTVSLADGSLHPSEQQVLLDHLASGLGLTIAEQERLTAHLRWLSVRGQAGATLAGLTRRLSGLPETSRSEIAQVLVMVAAADGVISATEVTALLKIYKLLGLDPDQVYSALHDQSVSRPDADSHDSGPHTRDGDSADPRPKPTMATPGARLVLDHRRLAAAAASTAEVSSLLGAVFADDDEPAPSQPPTEVAPLTSRFNGLDAPHSAMLAELILRTRWARAEFDALAVSLELMPSAALDTINDYAFDRCDEPLLDVDDDLILNDFAVQELTR
jgi:tellurite resistance protein/tetratricopeptide (TPR) repeat protein